MRRDSGLEQVCQRVMGAPSAIGEMLARAEKMHRVRVRGGDVVERCDHHEAPTLADMGLTRDESSRYQQLVAMPADCFETAVATAKATAGGDHFKAERPRRRC